MYSPCPSPVSRPRRVLAALAVLALAGLTPLVTSGDAARAGERRHPTPPPGTSSPPSAQRRWLVPSGGGLFAFGAAGFFGSPVTIKLTKAITGMSPSAAGCGYRVVASDGGIFSFGDAPFF